MYLTTCRIQHDENERAKLECYELCFQRVIMVALWNRADHYIFMMWFVLPSYGRPM